MKPVEKREAVQQIIREHEARVFTQELQEKYFTERFKDVEKDPEARKVITQSLLTVQNQRRENQLYVDFLKKQLEAKEPEDNGNVDRNNKANN